MSDPNAPGEPVEEPQAHGDVVDRANAGLADAEAAGREAVVAPTEPAVVTDAPAAAVDAQATGDVPWYDRPDVPLDDAPLPAEPVVAADLGRDERTEVIAPAVVAPAAVAPVAVAPAAVAQPIFVQAPEPPRPRGNRAAAGAIGILAAIVYAVLYLGVWLCIGAIEGTVTGANLGDKALAALGTWALWVPVAVFFVAFWLLGAIVNRGRWGLWVVFGLLVGIASYAGHILGQLMQAPFWQLTSSEGQTLVQSQLLVPLAIAAFVIGRELTVWFGAWIAARGKRVTELNYEAQREYERTLEAGPTIVPSAQG